MRGCERAKAGATDLTGRCPDADLRPCCTSTRRVRRAPQCTGRSRSRNMRILVTNDDGIHAQGLKVCEEIARELSDDVWVVAPEYDQSGVSHSLSLNDPLRLREIGERHYAVKGTPTDCVIMGARHILPDSRPISCCRASTAAATPPRTCSIPAPSPARRRPACSAFRRSRCRRRIPPASKQQPHWETATKHAPDIIRPRAEDRHPARRAGQHQLPRLRAGRGQGHRGLVRRASATSSCCTSMRATTAAAIRTTGSPMRAAPGRPARTAPTSPRSPTTASR